MPYTSTDLSSQVRGDTWFLSFYAKESDGSPIDITSHQYWFTIKELIDDTDINAVYQQGPIVIDGVNGPLGLIQFIIPPNETFYFEARTYYYDVQGVSPTGVVSTLQIGKVKVIKDVTLYAEYVGAPGDIPAYPTVEITSSTYTVLPTDYYIGVNYSGQVTITLPSTSQAGKELIIKDESGLASINNIVLVGTVDNDAGGAVLAVNNGALHLLFREGWRII